jgi:hypothetical protein
MTTINTAFLFVKYLSNYFLNDIFNKKTSLYLYHHLGLGDHIINYGLIRKIIFLNPKDKYYIFSKKHNYESVKFMFRDVSNVEILSIPNDNFVVMFLRLIKVNSKLIIGFKNISNRFDIDFYESQGISFENRFQLNSFPRDFNSEKRLFNELNLKNKSYVFVHDDHSRNLVISDNYFENKIVIRPFKTDNIFEWCYIIENAEEVHCICSSFKALVDSMQVTKPKLFYHLNYVNKGKARNETYTTSNLNWEVV